MTRRARTVLVAVVCGVVLAAAAVARTRNGLAPRPAMVFEPVVVMATLELDGALVRGATVDRLLHGGRLHYGDPVSVSVTAYCLKGRTRRDRYVRQGIVAADPRIFPLARYLEIYVGRKYFGRFLVDDTGLKIKGNRLDIWTPTCREARIFGRQRGTAVLVPRPRGAAKDTVLTGRLGGKLPKK